MPMQTLPRHGMAWTARARDLTDAGDRIERGRPLLGLFAYS